MRINRVLFSGRPDILAAMSNAEDQANIEEVLNAGVASTEVDGQKTSFVSPADARKRLRELDQDDVAANGGRVKRPTIAKLRLWGG